VSSLEIRSETARDVDGIRQVNTEAFRDHPISRQTEHLIVEALRDAGALEVSLVALNEDRVVGHIALSTACVGDSESGWYLLGPLAVLPDLQRRGIGSALVESALAELRSAGADGCVLVGDPGYYGRFGFTTFPWLTHEGVPDEYVLAIPFTEAAPQGQIRAHKAFEVGL
jgi:putative acetyltransferase